MKYHDTGEKDLGHALAHWFEDVLDDNVAELRVQSGYFRLEAVRVMAIALQKAQELDLPTTFVIGSNEGDTTHSDAAQLMKRLGMPRDKAKLGFVSYGNYLFHPKVYHVTRKDGSQAAFIGSANFTPAGVAGWNVEAALSLDTVDGDLEAVLNQIALAVDKWFLSPLPEGVSVVHTTTDLDHLLLSGVLSAVRPPRVSKKSSAGSSLKESSLPNRKKLIFLPPWPDLPDAEIPSDDDIDSENEDSSSAIAGTPALDSGSPGSQDAAKVPSGATTSAAASVPVGALTSPAGLAAAKLPNTEEAGFASHFIIEPGATGPTSGAGALTGKTLANGAVGLILRLNKDSARRFTGGVGTANISIPIATVDTFKFGIYGIHKRPRAEISMRVRYVSDDLIVEGAGVETNIMGYGFAKGEAGHADIRMLMPGAILGLAKEAKIQGRPLPAEDDVYFLEWPTLESSAFRMTFLEKGSTFSNSAQALFTAADKSELVGGACYLPLGISPDW